MKLQQALRVGEGAFDLGDLGRRARKLLEASAKPAESEQLF